MLHALLYTFEEPLCQANIRYDAAYYITVFGHYLDSDNLYVEVHNMIPTSVTSCKCNISFDEKLLPDTMLLILLVAAQAGW